jgi:U2-associated protein SR140
MSEETLGRFFAEIGPVGTVKIMWRRFTSASHDWSLLLARSELEMEQARRGKISLQGFVAYMKRRDAETAVKDLDGADWGGIRLKVGFSKPVPIPSKAIYGALGLRSDV